MQQKTDRSTAASVNGLTNDLTVLVFQDNLASRTFKVPLAWITRLGWALGALLALAVLASILAARFYHTSRSGDPARVQDLETELAELKASYKSLESKAEAPRETTQAPPVVAAPAGDASRPAAPAAPAVESSSGAPTLFSALPSKVGVAADASSVIKMSSPRVTWHGRTLRVNFDLQYVGEEHGSQQGRIVLLARGPETLMAHPNGVLNGSSSDTLIAPDQGEYFSVSRFRSVTAEFGPMRSQSALREVEVLVLNQDNQILIHQSLKPNAATDRPSTARSSSGSSASSSNSDDESDEEDDKPSAAAAPAPAAPPAAPATTGGAQ